MFQGTSEDHSIQLWGCEVINRIQKSWEKNKVLLHKCISLGISKSRWSRKIKDHFKTVPRHTKSGILLVTFIAGATKYTISVRNNVILTFQKDSRRKKTLEVSEFL